jgi:hypothetical protein
MSTQAEARREPKIDWGSIFLGYLGAVSGAALSFVMILAVDFIITDELSSGSLSNFWGIGVGMLYLIGGWFWIIALVTAFLPFTVTCTIALRFKIRSIVFYIFCGALTSVILAPVYNAIRPIDIDVDRMFFRDWIMALPALIPVGIIGALVFWYIAGRHVGRADSSSTHAQQSN